MESSRRKAACFALARKQSLHVAASNTRSPPLSSLHVQVLQAGALGPIPSLIHPGRVDSRPKFPPPNQGPIFSPQDTFLRDALGPNFLFFWFFQTKPHISFSLLGDSLMYGYCLVIVAQSAQSEAIRLDFTEIELHFTRTTVLKIFT